MIVDSLAVYARAKPNRLACIELETDLRLTYRALDAAVDRTAAWLVGEVGEGSGARIAALARNCAALIVLQQACARAGAIFVPLNWRLTAAEIAELAADCAPVMLWYEADFVGVATTVALPGCPALALETLDATIASAPAHPPRHDLRDYNADAPAILLYTSGTSGRPKGVIVSGGNIFWGSTNFIHGNAVTGDSVFLCDMPMFHTAGLLAVVQVSLLAGATILISRGFDAAGTLARIADPALGITHYFCVPQMAAMMRQRPEFAPAMLTSLKVLAMGGAPNPAAQIVRFVREGVPMSDGYGMSETCSNFGMPVCDPAVLIAKAGSCGLPFLSVETRIVDEEGNVVPPETVGELLIRGPSVTRGYWNQPELSARSFTDGWFRTGDAAMQDEDGFFYIVDRRKDMYISGGENVYPAEVERALAELEAVGEVAVIGVADARWGEVGCAFVTPALGHAIDAATVIAHCRTRLARFKVPAAVVITDAIPHTASGKVQKHLLAARVPMRAGHPGETG